jgi:hypothetical protein
MSASKRQLGSLSTSSLVTLLWALALLQQRPASDWMCGCLGQLARCLDATCAAAEAVAPAVAAGAANAHDGASSGGSSSDGAAGVEPLTPQQLTRATWALASLDCQLPAATARALLQLGLASVAHADADSLAQLVWAWDRLDETPGKQHVQQLAAAARSRLMAHASESLGLQLAGSNAPLPPPVAQGHSAGPQLRPAVPSSSSSSSSSSLLKHQHQLPVHVAAAGGQVKLLRGRVVLQRPSARLGWHAGQHSHSSGSGSGSSPALQERVGAGLQPSAVPAARVQELAAAAAAHGVGPNPGLAAALRQARLAPGRQQLLRRLRSLPPSQQQSEQQQQQQEHVGSSSSC